MFSDHSQTDPLLKTIKLIWEFISQNGWFLGGSILLLIFILLGWFFVPFLCRGAITHLVSQIKHGKEPQYGFSTALFHFFPLFEMSLLKRGLEPVTFFTEFSFVARNLGIGAGQLVLPVLYFFAVLGLICLFFFNFTTQMIMLRDREFTSSISNSFRMVIANFGKVFKLLLLFFLVELRVLLNVVIVIVLPLFLAGVTGVFASLFSEQVGIIIGGVITFGLVLLTAYLTGILFVFSEAIWTIAYYEFDKAEKENEEEKEG